MESRFAYYICIIFLTCVGQIFGKIDETDCDLSHLLSRIEPHAGGLMGKIYRGYDANYPENIAFAVKVLPLKTHVTGKKTLVPRILECVGGLDQRKEYEISEKLSESAPLFPKQYGAFMCNTHSFLSKYCKDCLVDEYSKRKNRVDAIVMVSEFLRGESMRDTIIEGWKYLDVKRLFEFLRSSIFQILFSINIAHTKFAFAHFDIHTANLMFKGHVDFNNNCPGEDEFFLWKDDKHSWKIPKKSTCSHELKLIDYGLSLIGEGSSRISATRLYRNVPVAGRRIYDIYYFVKVIIGDLPRSFYQQLEQEYKTDYIKLQEFAQAVLRRHKCFFTFGKLALIKEGCKKNQVGTGMCHINKIRVQLHFCSKYIRNTLSYYELMEMPLFDDFKVLTS